MARLKVVVSKSPEQKYARTQANRDRRVARIARELAKASITFPARGRYYRRHP